MHIVYSSLVRDPQLGSWLCEVRKVMDSARNFVMEKRQLSRPVGGEKTIAYSL